MTTAIICLNHHYLNEASFSEKRGLKTTNKGLERGILKNEGKDKVEDKGVVRWAELPNVHWHPSPPHLKDNRHKKSVENSGKAAIGDLPELKLNFWCLFFTADKNILIWIHQYNVIVIILCLRSQELYIASFSLNLYLKREESYGSLVCWSRVNFSSQHCIAKTSPHWNYILSM